MPILRHGDDSPWVSEVQTALKARGFYERRVDGDFGDGTANAVRAFQHSVPLAVTGEADEPTVRALGLGHLVGTVGVSSHESVALLFPGTRFANIEVNLPFVVKGLVASGLDDKRMLLMALATIRAETSTFLPISEGVSRFNTSPGGQQFDLYDNRGDLGNRDVQTAIGSKGAATSSSRDGRTTLTSASGSVWAAGSSTIPTRRTIPKSPDGSSRSS